MNVPMITEVNQTEKDKYCIVSLICEILKKKKKQIEKHDKKKVKIQIIRSWLPEGLEEEKEGYKWRRISTELQ